MAVSPIDEEKSGEMEEEEEAEEGELRAEDEKKAEVPGREVQADGAKLRSILDPCLPSEIEVRRHALAHLPYRSWCPHCVRGRGKDSAHRRAESVGKFPEFSWDYCFPGEEEGHKITILVGKERRPGMVMAMEFQVAQVKKPLASVRRIVERGNKVVCSKEGSYIEAPDGRRTQLVEHNGTFALEIAYAEEALGFTRRAI